MPLIKPENFQRLITVEGIENLSQARQQGKGAIMLAMHFGSWELASLSCAMLNLPYKVMVKPQTRYSRPDELLNWYRSCGGYVVLSRGWARAILSAVSGITKSSGWWSTKGAETEPWCRFWPQCLNVRGGDPDGTSSGACRSVLASSIREPNGRHKMIVHKPMELINTGDPEKDIPSNLNRITRIMEDYIRRYPSEYMWFYKIWKYSNETSIAILSDGKTGHLRQSQAVAGLLQKALGERGISSSVRTTEIVFKSQWHRKLFMVLNLLIPPVFYRAQRDG